MEVNNAEKQYKKQNYDWLKQYQFQKGQSGNPGGAKKGKRLKTFALEMLENMDEEHKAEFLKELDAKTVWEMAEGKPKQDVEMSGELTSKIISVDE
jgi:uncharacterized protein YaaW (UPF0174 family)